MTGVKSLFAKLVTEIKPILSPHREVPGSQDFIRRRCQCLSGIIKSAAAADDDDYDATLSYDQRSVRAGPPFGSGI